MSPKEGRAEEIPFSLFDLVSHATLRQGESCDPVNVAAMENDAIIATVMNYFEGWFEGNSERMRSALHPDLNKRHIPLDLPEARLSAPSTATQMIRWTRDGEGKAERPLDPAIKVRIDDVYRQIATVTVYSAVYVEYLQLMRTPEGWRIVNALYMRRND